MDTEICQSCAMPLTSEDMFGTNTDGSTNKDYCKWCYNEGKFLDDCTMEETALWKNLLRSVPSLASKPE